LRAEARRSAIGFALLLSGVVVAIAAFPLYLYLSLALEQDRQHHRQHLQQHARELRVQMALFESGAERVFHFPRSPLFEAALIGADEKPVFSLLSQPPPVLKSGFMIAFNRAFWVEPLEHNLFQAKWLVVSMPHDRHALYLRLVGLFLVLALFFGVGSYALMVLFLRPFERTRQLQELFFKDAMHEIKTPLGVLSMNLEMLSQKLGSQPAMKRMRYAVKNLTTIYEDIEHLIRHRYVTYTREKIALDRFIADRIAWFEDVAQIRQVHLSAQLQADIPIHFSRVELQRLVDNNLSNAIKYSHENTRVRIWLKRSDGGIILRFIDRGVGMDDTRRIFTRHYRGDAIKGGFGIGLSIVKQICDKNGVRVRVCSKAGVGTLFEYRFDGAGNSTGIEV
jgi:signal transduction histidine kinase